MQQLLHGVLERRIPAPLPDRAEHDLRDNSVLRARRVFHGAADLPRAGLDRMGERSPVSAAPNLAPSRFTSSRRTAASFPRHDIGEQPSHQHHGIARIVFLHAARGVGNHDHVSLILFCANAGPIGHNRQQDPCEFIQDVHKGSGFPQMVSDSSL